jgi:hypothetical protein
MWVPWRAPLPRLVSFWSHDDMILRPVSTALVDGAENIELSGFTHYDYLLQPRSWRAVFRAL